MCNNPHLKDFHAKAATSFNFCFTQRVPFVALAPIVARRQAEDESLVCLKVKIYSCLGHVEEDHLVLTHASTKSQLNFCMWDPCVVNATNSTTRSRCPYTSCLRISWSYTTHQQGARCCPNYSSKLQLPARLCFPRKMANVNKMFARDSTRWATGSAAALSYPDPRTPNEHHKKGRPSAATFYESRPGKPSFCIFWLPPLRPAVGQITQKYRAWQAFGILS